jgi:hypothetical protein
MLAAVLMECVPDGSTRHTNQLFLSTFFLSLSIAAVCGKSNIDDGHVNSWTQLYSPFFCLCFYLRMEEKGVDFVDVCLVCCCHVVVLLLMFGSLSNTQKMLTSLVFIQFPPFRSS